MIYFILHLVLSGLIVLIFTNKSNKRELFYNLLIALFLPIGGYMLVIIFNRNRKIPLKQVEEDEIEKKVLLFTGRVQGGLNKNIIPLEETLIMNSNKVKRQQLLDYLKKESIHRLSILKTALKDSDVETSHYASAAIIEEKRKIEVSLQEFSVHYEKNKDDLEFIEGYGNVLKIYIESGLLDDYTKRRYGYSYINILKHKNEIVKTIKNYEDIIDALIEFDMLAECGVLCKEFLENFHCEEAYIKNLKYFYSVNDKERFKEIFEKLLGSELSFSPKCLELVRFWNGQCYEG